MLGNPLVRFCEGQGGNRVMVHCTPSLRAPCLLDRNYSNKDGLFRVGSCGFVDRGFVFPRLLVWPPPLRVVNEFLKFPLQARIEFERTLEIAVSFRVPVLNQEDYAAIGIGPREIWVE